MSTTREKDRAAALAACPNANLTRIESFADGCEHARRQTLDYLRRIQASTTRAFGNTPTGMYRAEFFRALIADLEKERQVK